MLAPAIRQDEKAMRTAGLLLGFLPVVSFGLQYLLSVQSHTQTEFFQHFTCAYVDWLFVPFNLIVVRIIDWRRGGALLLIVLVSIIANIIAHASWQYYGTDGGHMVLRGTQTMLPAGWVHLGFSTIETTLVLAFAFIRRPRNSYTRLATGLAVAFFLATGISGYAIHRGFITTDAIVVWAGTAIVAVYPWLTGRAASRSRSSNRKNCDSKELRRAHCAAAGQE